MIRIRTVAPIIAGMSAFSAIVFACTGQWREALRAVESALLWWTWAGWIEVPR